jgi:glucokinase
MKSALAADLGGTKVRFALVSEDGRLWGARKLPTPRDRAGLLTAIDESFAAIAAERPAELDEPSAIGVGLAGVVAADGARVSHAPNLALDDFALVAHLEARWQLPTALLNDGRASALGEYAHGEAKGNDPLLVLFFGTGIGIGLVVDGRPYRGVNNAAGEVGHTIHVPGGEPCSCGRRGCYEAYCGGKPIGERARRELGSPPGPGGWSLAAILEAAERDERARRIITQARVAAGAMVASLCTLLNPAAVVLGGGVLQGWPALRGEIERASREWCTRAVTERLRFVRSALESDAILLGAAAASGAFRDSPARA